MEEEKKEGEAPQECIVQIENPPNKEEKRNDKEEDNKEEEKKEGEKVKKKKKKEKKVKKEKKNSEKLNLVLSVDEENGTCVDCGKSNPTKVSINNGVIICEECALKHEELGHSVSYVKNIDDDFDEYLLNFIVFGSNYKFKKFLADENVDASLPIEKKYLTKAALFYRINLKKKVKSEELIEVKNYKSPNELIEIENLEDKYPEFEHYQMKSKINNDGSFKEKPNTKLNKLGGSIVFYGKKMYDGIKIGANYVAKKAEAPTKTIKKGAQISVGFVGKHVNQVYETLKKNVIKNKKDKNKKGEGETEDEKKKNPPPIIDNNDKNAAESRRPLQQENEIKEEKVEKGKEVNDKEDKKGDSNE